MKKREIKTMENTIFKLKRIFGVTILGLAVFSALFVFARENPSTLAQSKAIIYFFYTNTCPHCAKEKQFLENLRKELPNLEIRQFEVDANSQNLELMKKVGEELKIDTGSIPLTIIGSEIIIGYFDDAITGKVIREAVKVCFEKECSDKVAEIIGENSSEPVPKTGESPKIFLPVLGEINPKTVSLPILTVVIGGLDGFNPCAMWILIFLISLLLGIENRKRRWILGGTFIITSAAVYFMFMAAWLNFFLFLGFIWWVRIGVALVAIISGVFYLKKYFNKKAEVCEITQDVKKQKILEKLKAIALEKKFWLALAGIIMLAGVVNLFELLCSAGFPAIYTKILAMSQLATWQYYAYLLLYIFIFMLDDMAVFGVAMFTLENVVFGKKYNKISILVGGLFMLAIGFLLLFRPEILSFKF